MSRTRIILIRLALLVVVLGAWEYFPSSRIINPMLLPAFSDVVVMLGDILMRPQMHEAIRVTALEVLLAFAIAVPLGTVIGIVIGENDYLSQIFRPIIFYIFATPNSTFLPIFILVFGIGFQQKVAYAAFSATFVVLMSASAAVESVRPDHVMVARSFGATRLQILRRIYLPSMLPVLLETLRIAMIFTFTGVMVAEMYASRTGIGHMIASWGENFQMAQLLGGVIILSAVAIMFNEAVRSIEVRYGRWRT